MANRKRMLVEFPDLMSQWHPTKNLGLDPLDMPAGSTDVVWWYLEYDDLETGQHFTFEWQDTVRSRAFNGKGCPFLNGRSVWRGFNDLATKYPDIAKLWHPTKNGDLTPEMVKPSEKRDVWWYLSYDDPETGQRFNFEWKAKINNMVASEGKCPYLSGQRVWPGFNDLATKYPDVALLWHPTKNGRLTPDQVSAHSGERVWWHMSYDDSVSGKHFDFEWDNTVVSQVSAGVFCPYLTNQRFWPGFNDLATKRPNLAAQWHPQKNGSLRPETTFVNSTEKVWWFISYDDTSTGRHHDFEWEDTVIGRTKNRRGCPFLTSRKVLAGYNDLATTHPEVAKLWHPTKNCMTPEQVKATDNVKVWWLLSYTDSTSGEHYIFEWESRISSMVASGGKCPYLSGHNVEKGFNDLATTRPDIAQFWHPTKNGNLSPDKVTVSSNREVWWLMPYDDPKTGKHFDFVWKARIFAQVQSVHICPYLTGQRVWPGFNDLATLYPEIAQQWHPTKNGELRPDQVTAGSAQKVYWFMPYNDPRTGKHFDFTWRARIINRIEYPECPYLTGKRVYSGFNDLATLYPEIASQWHPTKNGDLTPDKVTATSEKVVWWRLPYDDPGTGRHFDFEWVEPISYRVEKGPNTCPILSGKKVWTGFNDLETVYPTTLAKEYNTSLNHGISPSRIKSCSNQKIWWTCKKCGHSWRMSIAYRVKFGGGCPKCKSNRIYK